jgi:GTP-binding protein
MYNTKVAQTSSSPGKTKSLNYYLVEGKFYIVDLPGFGYAKVSKQERDSWRRLIEQYFSLNKNIKLAVHLIDSRHEPMQPDLELNEFLRTTGLAYMVLLNKADKLKQSELAAAKKRIKEYFPEMLMNENCFLYSTVKGTGKKEVSKLLTVLFET